MTPPLLALRGVAKAFGDTQALQGIDLEVARGQTMVLIGSSGCGKSTVLRLVIGLLAPDAGEVRFDGAVVPTTDDSPHRRRIGYVVQEGGLFAHLTAGENVALPARHAGWDAARIGARLGELRELVRLPPEALQRYPVQLSGGQRQRVSLMRALMLDPDVLLFDEPLSALDPITRADLSQDLRSIFQSLQKTVVLVTHDLGEAAFFADRVALMNDGAIVQRGTMPDLLETPATPFVSRFVSAQRSPLDAASSPAPAPLPPTP